LARLDDLTDIFYTFINAACWILYGFAGGFVFSRACRVCGLDERLLKRRGGRNIQDEAIIRKVVEGDRESFRLIVEKYRSYLYRVVYPILSHPKDAEDVTQEVLVKLYVSLPQYQFQGFKTWMTRIAVNRAIDFKRSRDRKKEDATDTVHGTVDWDQAPDPADSAELDYFRQAKREHILHRIDELPSNYRNVVYAFFIEDKSYQEIASEQGVAVKTVESKLYRAKQWIRGNWKEDDFA
jgi:RNA polymerase sigma factor (sigma-70 family)